MAHISRVSGAASDWAPSSGQKIRSARTAARCRRSTIAQFGTAADIALADLRIELLFPADDETRALYQPADGPSGGARSNAG